MAGKKSGTKRKTRWRTLSMDDGNGNNGTGNCVTSSPTSISQKTFKNSVYTMAKLVSTTIGDSPSATLTSSNYEDKHNDYENMRNNNNNIAEKKRSNFKTYHNNNYQYNNYNSINKKYYKYNNGVAGVTNLLQTTTVGIEQNSEVKASAATATNVPPSSYRSNQHKYFNNHNNNELATETTTTTTTPSSTSSNYHYNNYNNNYYYKRRPFHHNNYNYNYNSSNKYVLNKNVSDNDKENNTIKEKSTEGTTTVITNDDTKTAKPTFNEDDYTRITTPRQDVLFKKGYLSRPKTYLLNATPAVQSPSSIDNHTDVNYSSSGPVSVTSTEDSTLPSTQSVTPEHRNSANDMLNNFNDFAYMYPSFVDPNGSFFYINPYLSNGFDSYTGQMIMMPYGANTAPLNNTVTNLDNNNNAKDLNDNIEDNPSNEEDTDKINQTNPIINADKNDVLTDKVLIENSNESLTEISISATDCKNDDKLTETVVEAATINKDQSNLDTSYNLNENVAIDDIASTVINNPINPNIDNDTIDYTPYYPQYFNPYLFRQAQVFGMNGMGYNDAFVNYGVPYDDSTYSRQYRYKKRKRRTRRPINSVGGTTSDYSDDESIENNERYIQPVITDNINYNDNYVNTCSMIEQNKNEIINELSQEQAENTDDNLEIPNNDLVIKKSQLNVEVKEFLPRNYNKMENKTTNDNIDNTININCNNNNKNNEIKNAFNENVNKTITNNKNIAKPIINKEIKIQSSVTEEKLIKKKNVNKIIKDDKKIINNNGNHKTFAQILHNKIQSNDINKVQVNDKIIADNNASKNKVASIKVSPKWQTVRNKKNRGKNLTEDSSLNEKNEIYDDVLQEGMEKQKESDIIVDNHSDNDECITIVEVISEIDVHKNNINNNNNNNNNNNSTAAIADTKANNKLLNKNNKKVKSKHNNKKQTTNGCLTKKLQGFEVIEPNFNKSPLKKKTEFNNINNDNENNDEDDDDVDADDDIIDDKLNINNFCYNNNNNNFDKEINNINSNNVINDNNNSCLLNVDDNAINNIVINTIKNYNDEYDVIVDEMNINVINDNNVIVNNNNNNNNIFVNENDFIIEENYVDKTIFLNENINEITELITQIELNELDIENIIIHEKINNDDINIIDGVDEKNDDKILLDENASIKNELKHEECYYKNQSIEKNTNLSIMNAVTKWLDDEKKKDISEPIFRLPNDPLLLKILNLSLNVNYNDSTDDDDDDGDNMDDDDDDNFTNSTETDTDYDDHDCNDKLNNKKKIKSSSNDNNNIITLPLDTDSDYMSDTQIKNDGCLPKKEKNNINNGCITSNTNHYQNNNNNTNSNNNNNNIKTVNGDNYLNSNNISNKRHITNNNNDNDISMTKTKAIKNRTLDVLTNTINNLFTFNAKNNTNNNNNTENDLIVEQIKIKKNNNNSFSKASLLVDSNSNSKQQQQMQNQPPPSSPALITNEQRCVLM